jgi:mono/diheme cytochrome c family protein
MLATTSTTIAWVIFLVTLVGWIVYFFLNKGSARPELGSEIELAPNRKPYYDDETLEGPRLERMQVLGVLLLAVLVIGLPLYWIFEPSRQAGAVEARSDEFVTWGAELFDVTANGGFNCAGCHGGMNALGGQAPYAITDPTTGEVKPVNWYAPALNTVFYRYSDEEVTFILNYGRPFSPMSAWGAPGGGPMTTQNIETVISYLHSIQIPPVGCLDPTPFSKAAGAALGTVCAGGELPADKQSEISAAAQQAAQQLVDAGKYATVDAAMGEALFNLDLSSGAYSCARCHTQGWSYGDPGVTGQGAFGWNLTGGSVASHFPNEADMIAFIKAGSVNGARYGRQGQGSGRMPGFGALLTDEQIKKIVEYVRSL